MSYYYKKYEWTAFSEADLLANGKNGYDFGCGDSFTVGAATVKMATYDNDSPCRATIGTTVILTIAAGRTVTSMTARLAARCMPNSITS